MPALPERPDLSQLRTQAKDLLRAFRRGDSGAASRVRQALPAARGTDDAALAALEFRLHDAQSCIAREYGFASWAELRAFVDTQTALRAGLEEMLATWLPLAYGRGTLPPKPAVAARLFEHRPDLIDAAPVVACAVGDRVRVRAAIERDPTWLARPLAPLGVPPLVAVTHSGLARLPGWSDALLRCAEVMLSAGADPNQSWIDPAWPDSPLSALYGAAGKNHHAALTAALLHAGANPNDGESLYHAVESGDPACAALLLDAGAAIEGTNALHHALDFDPLAPLVLLLARGADPNARLNGDRPIHHAIRRGRSGDHVAALLNAGADPTATTADGIRPYRLALRHGALAVAALLRARGCEEPIPPEEEFVGACARGDAQSAARLRRREPDVLTRLSPEQLRLLPDLAALKRWDAVRVMIDAGWPIDAQGGGWNATALNIAVFQGDAGLTAWLLARGADWRVPHGYDDTVVGTLSYASIADDADGDWLGCARALVAAGMPLPPPAYRFSDEVSGYFREIAHASGVD